jgi:hypothetical protein
MAVATHQSRGVASQAGRARVETKCRRISERKTSVGVSEVVRGPPAKELGEFGDGEAGAAGAGMD